MLPVTALKGGKVVVEGEARLYEGSTEKSQDLDGRRKFDLLVPRNNSRVKHVTVKNTDEGGDYADVSMRFTNQVTKSEE